MRRAYLVYHLTICCTPSENVARPLSTAQPVRHRRGPACGVARPAGSSRGVHDPPARGWGSPMDCRLRANCSNDMHLIRGGAVGTPDQVSEKIQRYLDAGCTGFIPWCSDYPSTETLELFAKKVIPNFR